VARTVTFWVVDRDWNTVVRKELTWDRLEELKELLKKGFFVSYDSALKRWRIKGVKDLEAAREFAEKVGAPELIERLGAYRLKASVRLDPQLHMAVIDIPSRLTYDMRSRIEDVLRITYNREKYDPATKTYELIPTTVRIGRIETTPEGIRIVVAPRFLHRVINVLKSMGIDVEVEKPHLKTVDLKTSFEEVYERLRPYQREAIDAWIRNGYRGTIVIPTGGGKTWIGLAAIAKLRVPTLILVPNEALLEQWARKIEEVLGIKPAIFGGGKHEVGDITVATYQSAYRHIDKLWNRFGLLICDECHRVPAERFFEAVRMIATPYVLGLTATPERDDKNEHLIFESLGPIVYRIPYTELAKEGWLAPILVEMVPVEPTPEDERRLLELSKMMRRGNAPAEKIRAEIDRILALDPNKISKIVELAIKAVEQGRKVIIFGNLIDQLKRIYDELVKRLGREKVAVYVGRGSVRQFGVSSSRRDEEIERFRRGEARILILNQAAEEGIDIPDADVEIMASAYKTKRQMIQRVGRIARPAPGKLAGIVYLVYIDPWEAHRAKAWYDVLNEIVPQDEMRRLVEERRRLEAESRRLGEGEGAKVIRRVMRHEERVAALERALQLVKERYPFIYELVVQALNKTPRKLTVKEKRALIFLANLADSYGFMRDVGRESKHRARYVRTWLRDWSRRDLPGVDTPDIRGFARRIARLIREGRIDEAAQLVLSE